MTASSFFAAWLLFAWAWLRLVRRVGQGRPLALLAGLLCPRWLAWRVVRQRLDLDVERALCLIASVCLLPSMFYFGFWAR